MISKHIQAQKCSVTLLNNISFLSSNQADLSQLEILHQYHFGGYAKFTQQLVDFMNHKWIAHHLPLDFVYTAKALYAVYDLANKKHSKRKDICH